METPAYQLPATPSPLVIVIGASTGGVAALRQLVAALPADFDAVVLVVLHVGEHRSSLPWLLSSSGPLPARHASDGDRLLPGQIFVAPPDSHMLVTHDAVRLSRGAREHHTRPAIDPLFRSAALAHGSRTIGVVLSGTLDDGTAGLQAIKSRGGLVLVQEPREAQEPGMPSSALRYVQVDQCLPVARIAEVLASRVAGERPPETPPDTGDTPLQREHAVSINEGNGIDDLESLGQPSGLACPDCNGGLWQLAHALPPRFRCHTGHAYTLLTLAQAHGEATEDALWNAIRALQEQEIILRRLARTAHAADNPALGNTADAKADESGQQAELLLRLVKKF